MRRIPGRATLRYAARASGSDCRVVLLLHAGPLLLGTPLPLLVQREDVVAVQKNLTADAARADVTEKGSHQEMFSRNACHDCRAIGGQLGRQVRMIRSASHGEWDRVGVGGLKQSAAPGSDEEQGAARGTGADFS